MKVFLFLQIILMVYQFLSANFGFSNIRYSHFFFNFPRVSGFFNEPANIAISLSPFYFIVINQKKWFIQHFGYFSVIILYIIIVFSPSATLFAVIIMNLIIFALSKYHMNGRHIFRFITYVFFMIILFSLVIIYIPNIGHRISSVFKYFQVGALTGISNISALIYIKGYQMASYALINYPLGVGFINMEVLNDYSSVSHLSPTLYELNKENGSSMLFKIVSEYGILGLMFFGGCFFRLIKLARYKGDIIEQAFLFSFLASGVRGPTYFDGALFIGISIYVFYLKAKFTVLLKAVIKDGNHKKKVIIYSH